MKKNEDLNPWRGTTFVDPKTQPSADIPSPQADVQFNPVSIKIPASRSLEQNGHDQKEARMIWQTQKRFRGGETAFQQTVLEPGARGQKEEPQPKSHPDQILTRNYETYRRTSSGSRAGQRVLRLDAESMHERSNRQVELDQILKLSSRKDFAKRVRRKTMR